MRMYCRDIVITVLLSSQLHQFTSYIAPHLLQSTKLVLTIDDLGGWDE